NASLPRHLAWNAGALRQKIADNSRARSLRHRPLENPFRDESRAHRRRRRPAGQNPSQATGARHFRHFLSYSATPRTPMKKSSAFLVLGLLLTGASALRATDFSFAFEGDREERSRLEGLQD